MDQDRDRKFFAAQGHLGAAFSAAIAEMNQMPVGAERSRHLRGLATLLVGQPEEFKATVVSQCPELEVAEPFPDTLLDEEQCELVSQLARSDLDVIDEALVHSSVSTWRKVPRVIGGAMVALDCCLPGLPLGLYVRRVGALVEGGRLLAKGNLEFMHLSEVKLPALDGLEA